MFRTQLNTKTIMNILVYACALTTVLRKQQHEGGAAQRSGLVEAESVL